MLFVLRRFWIQPGSFDEFERVSREEIWPPMEATGARVQGLYRAHEPEPHSEVNEPCEMAVVITGYVDRAHWTATRARPETWCGDKALRQKLVAGRAARHAPTIRTEPTFMKQAHVRIGGPFRTWPDAGPDA